MSFGSRIVRRPDPQFGRRVPVRSSCRARDYSVFKESARIGFRARYFLLRVLSEVFATGAPPSSRRKAIRRPLQRLALLFFAPVASSVSTSVKRLGRLWAGRVPGCLAAVYQCASPTISGRVRIILFSKSQAGLRPLDMRKINPHRPVCKPISNYFLKFLKYMKHTYGQTVFGIYNPSTRAYHT